MPVNFELLENIVNSDYVLDIDKDTNEIIDTGIEREYLKPEIINPESNFVVVTYWWGRGRDNANIARPCMAYYEVIISDIKSYTIEYFERIYRSIKTNLMNTSFCFTAISFMIPITIFICFTFF